MTKLKKINSEDQIFKDVARLIEESKQHVAQTVNSTLTLLYWKIGKRINHEVLQNQRADYGKQIVATLSQQLTLAYGKGFNYSGLTRMVKFAEVFPDERIVVSAMRQLSWSHFVELIPLKQPLQREFYAEMCRIENWSVKTLSKKIDGMLYERTAVSKKPDQLIKQEIKSLRDADKLTPDLVFRNPYFLDFLGLKITFS
ncbi:MAG: DUF1016 N-terminal domain-containing protein [Daejeonella sp.]